MQCVSHTPMNCGYLEANEIYRNLTERAADPRSAVNAEQSQYGTIRKVLFIIASAAW